MYHYMIGKIMSQCRMWILCVYSNIYQFFRANIQLKTLKPYFSLTWKPYIFWWKVAETHRKRQRRALPFSQPDTFSLLIFFMIFVILKTAYLHVCGKVRVRELKKDTQQYIFYINAFQHWLNFRPERKKFCLTQVYITQTLNVKRDSGSCWKQQW